MRLKEIGEDHFIKAIERRFSAEGLGGGARGRRVLKGIGDDTSVTLPGPGTVTLATTDTLAEGTHFQRAWADPYLLGRKSLSISISDIAAMGGEPFFFLISLQVPARTTLEFIDRLYKGVSDVAEGAGAVLAGGNTARASRSFSITTTLVGEAPQGRVVYRKGARPGETIYVTGTLGDSALGLAELKRGGLTALKGPLKKAVRRHLDPTARLEAGRGLARRSIATAMIDISDGLLIDLKRLCSESSTGAVVSAPALPLSRELRRHMKERGRTGATALALAGGEDYELLFTARPADGPKIERLATRLGLAMTPVGEVAPPEEGITVTGEDGVPLKIKREGFTHF
ncbi:MAG: thiamine-phosphate kinase [Thermodesulfobacteriota bacterium]